MGRRCGGTVWSPYIWVRQSLAVVSEVSRGVTRRTTRPVGLRQLHLVCGIRPAPRRLDAHFRLAVIHTQRVKSPMLFSVMICAATALSSACGADSGGTATSPASSAASVVAGRQFETANAPIKELLRHGEHCFATGVEAVAAQLRAAAADAKNDADDDDRQARGELRLASRDYTIVEDVEDNGACYWVRTNSPLG